MKNKEFEALCENLIRKIMGVCYKKEDAINVSKKMLDKAKLNSKSTDDAIAVFKRVVEEFEMTDVETFWQLKSVLLSSDHLSTKQEINLLVNVILDYVNANYKSSNDRLMFVDNYIDKVSEAGDSSMLSILKKVKKKLI